MLFRFALPVFSLLAAVSAVAQNAPDAPQDPATRECTSDVDCGDGSFCALPPCACSDDNGDGACDSDCGPGSCVVAEEPTPPCAADADCGAGEVCITETYDVCSGGGGASRPCEAGNEACDPTEPAPPPPDECSSETVSYCAPPYFAACEADADCGPGFACIAEEICTCTGSVGPDGSTEPNPPEDCSCDTGDKNVCVLVRTTCAEDADCAAGLVCVDENVSVCDAEGPACERDVGAAERICAPESGFGGDVRTQEEVDAAQAGEDANVDDSDDDGERTISINCAQVGPTGLLPVAALALLLRRRRR